jgi:hypothetical protein
VLGCAGREIGGEAPGAVLQLSLRRRELKLHRKSPAARGVGVKATPARAAIIRGLPRSVPDGEQLLDGPR